MKKDPLCAVGRFWAGCIENHLEEFAKNTDVRASPRDRGWEPGTRPAEVSGSLCAEATLSQGLPRDCMKKSLTTRPTASLPPLSHCQRQAQDRKGSLGVLAPICSLLIHQSTEHFPGLPGSP